MEKRLTGLIAGVVFAVSWFLPAAHEISGYEAFWLSLRGMLHVADWELESLPLVFAWIANVGALYSLFVLATGRRVGARSRYLAATGILAVGPALVSFGDLRIAYYLWAVSLLALCALVWFDRRGRLPPAV